jgi:hypothetical protein
VGRRRPLLVEQRSRIIRESSNQAPRATSDKKKPHLTFASKKH